MQERDNAKMTAKQEKRKQDLEDIDKFKSELKKERNQQFKEELRQKIEFMDANQELVKNKVEKVEKFK